MAVSGYFRPRQPHNILGSRNERDKPFPRILSFHRRGKLPVDRLRSGFLVLEDINAGFDRLADGEVVRQILVFPRIG